MDATTKAVLFWLLCLIGGIVLCVTGVGMVPGVLLLMFALRGPRPSDF